MFQVKVKKDRVIKYFNVVDSPGKLKRRRSKRESFKREWECLVALSDYEYFPQLLKVDEKKLELHMTNVGGRFNKKDIGLDDATEQWKIIAQIVIDKNIVRHYINMSDFLLHDGQLRLIDFELAYLKGSPLALKKKKNFNLIDKGIIQLQRHYKK